MNNLSYPFEKKHRLLSPNQFRQVFDNCEKKYHSKHLMAFVITNDCPHARLGLAITKKKVPTAVARNQLKRLARENFRLSLAELKNKDMVIIAKRPINELTKAQLTAEIQQLLSKIKQS